MENKYYTPNIEEITLDYIGEALLPSTDIWKCDTWTKFTINKENFSSYSPWQGDGSHIDDVLNKVTLNEIRTKYLDSDDIISLGFEQLDTVDIFFGKNSYLYTVPKNTKIIYEMDGYDVRLYLKHEQGKIRIEKQMFGGFSGSNELYEQVYYGACKSKNELKKILEWIK